MNKVIFTGRLTRTPELKHTTDGTPVLTAGIAVDDGWGEKKRTYFPDCVFWRHHAEYLAKYAEKGDLLEVSCKYMERKYTAKDGSSRTVKEFEADEVKILQSRRPAAQGPQNGAHEPVVVSEDEYTDITGEPGELPF